MGLDPSEQITEREIHDYHIPEDVGVHWRDLARALIFSNMLLRPSKRKMATIPRSAARTFWFDGWAEREGMQQLEYWLTL